MIRGHLFFLLVHHLCFTLRTDSNLFKCFGEVFVANTFGIASCRYNRCLVGDVCQVRSRRTRRLCCEFIEVYRVVSGLIFEMYFQDSLTVFSLRQTNGCAAVEATRTEKRRVENISTVSGRQDDDVCTGFKSIHFDEDLIECLLTLIVTTAHATTAFSSYCINFINKDDRRSVLFGFLEQIAHPARTNTDKHFHKLTS